MISISLLAIDEDNYSNIKVKTSKNNRPMTTSSGFKI